MAFPKMSSKKAQMSPANADEAIMKEGKPSLAIAFGAQQGAKKRKMASGGEVMPADFMEDEERAESIAEAIMQKRRKFAEGGMVDLESNSEEKPNEYDELNADAAGKEQYDDSQISPQPTDSNETGDTEEEDSENKNDMVSMIRRKLKAKSGA